MRTALLQQNIVIVLASLVLDEGQAISMATIAIAAHSLAFTIPLLRRPRSPTEGDMILIRYGYLLILVAVILAGPPAKENCWAAIHEDACGSAEYNMPMSRLLTLVGLFSLCLAVVGIAWASGSEFYLFIPGRTFAKSPRASSANPSRHNPRAARYHRDSGLLASPERHLHLHPHHLRGSAG